MGRRMQPATTSAIPARQALLISEPLPSRNMTATINSGEDRESG